MFKLNPIICNSYSFIEMIQNLRGFVKKRTEICKSHSLISAPTCRGFTFCNTRVSWHWLVPSAISKLIIDSQYVRIRVTESPSPTHNQSKQSKRIISTDLVRKT